MKKDIRQLGKIGRWKCTVDKKWRLPIPTQIRGQFDHIILFTINTDDGCLKIAPKPKGLDINIRSEVYIRRIRGGKIIIPPRLRDSNSFFLGRKTLIVAKENHFELWPWPETSQGR